MSLNTIKLITWNIRWGRGIDNVVDLNRTMTHLSQFSDFDILCLQEVASGYSDPDLKYANGSNQFEFLEKKLKNFVPVNGYAVDHPLPEGKSKRFGNMIFSRFPVLQVYRHRLPQLAEQNVKSMPRMALEILIETPIGILCVINTHLEFYSAHQRMAQVQYLRNIYQAAWEHANLIDQKKDIGPFSSYPQIKGCILAGDFNFSASSPERKKLLSIYGKNQLPPLIDTWESLYPNKEHAPTMGYFDRTRWPEGPFVSDYIFISKNLEPKLQKVQVEKESLASDHQALLLELKI